MESTDCTNRRVDGFGMTTVVGAGVVGTATGRGLAGMGRRVSYYDVSTQRVNQLKADGFEVWDESQVLANECDTYLISVSTPTRNGRIDLTAMKAAAELIGRAMASAQDWRCVVVRSTVPPGTTEDVVRPILEKFSHAKAGRDFGLVMNPEFLRAATAERDFMEPRVIVYGSLDARCEEHMRSFYRPWEHVATMPVSIREAEATKYIANTFNATKISFFNEIHGLLENLEIESSTAIAGAVLGAEGLWNPNYGTKGGFPYGGECLPKDTTAFLAFVRDQGLEARMLAATIETNAIAGGKEFRDGYSGG